MEKKDNPLYSQRLIQGMMRLENLDEEGVLDLMQFDVANGLSFFDVSDIYRDGTCEAKMGAAFKMDPSLREKVIIQTKVGLLNKKPLAPVTCYDLSYEHIMEGCDASLKRLQTDHIDYYLLHRPDILMESRDIARAFRELKASGKVRHFGVSNFSPETIKYITDETHIPIEVNQLQLGLGHLDMVSEVLDMNVTHPSGIPYGQDSFYFCKRHHIAIQCWSPYLSGELHARTSIFTDPALAKTNELLASLGQKYHLTPGGMATAFLLQLGDNIQVVTGSTDKEHIKEAIAAVGVKLSKEDFYDIFISTGNPLP